MNGLKFEKPLAELKEKIAESGSKVFSDMVREFMVNNTHRTTVELVPSKTMEEELLKDEQDRFAAIQSKLTNTFRMKLMTLVPLIATTATFRSVTSFSIPRTTSSLLSKKIMTSVYSSSTPSAESTTATKFTQPPRVIPSVTDLPTLYVYDHCPFCVRVRAVFGLKNIKHNLFFLANDDVITPTNLVGKKISPIYEWKSSGICMPESLDIIAHVDGDDRMGPTDMILPATGREDLKAWQNSVRDLLRGLQRPRYVATGLLPEFQQLDGRIAFIQNHEMVGYTKDEWKKSEPPMPIEQKIEIYNSSFQKDPATDIEELNRKLIELDDIIFCEHYVTDVTPNTHGNCLSIDDIDLFARLRSITIIKNVKWPSKLRNYMDYMSQLTDIPLYDTMAM